jgi:hypothetical protein
MYPMPMASDPGNTMRPGNELAPGLDFGGQNQYMNYPSMTSPGSMSFNNTTPPGAVPPSGSSPFFPYSPGALNTPGGVGSSYNLPSGARTGPTLDPAFTQGLDAWLQSQMGKGASPFNLSAYLPSTGGTTGPGQVAAPLTPELQQLARFLQTGQGGGAGTGTLEQMATTGMPTDVGPAWQAMISSEQRNVDEKANQLREQFAGMGDLASSPFGTSITDFYTQTALGQNAQLTQAEQQAQEAAAGRMAGASQFLTGTAGNLGEYLQGLDEQSIQTLMQEFIRSSPDYNPLLSGEFQLGTTFPPIYGKSGFGASFGSALGGALGSSLGSFGISAGGGKPPVFSTGG